MGEKAITSPASRSPSANGRSELWPFFRELATLPAKQRLDRIIARPDTMRVVRQMPVLDLYTTLRDVGVEDALEVLELMSPAQVQGFLDVDGWRKDRVDPTAMARWLKTFFSANVERAVGQLRGLDLELLTLLVKMHCKVYDLTLDEQPEDLEVGRHTLTPDQRFLIVFGGVGGDEETQAVMQQFLERLMARDMLFVLRLCEALRWELPSTLEEDALRWRNARLADLGFLPTEEAAAVFAWLDPEKARSQQAPPSRPPVVGADDVVSTDLTTSPLLPWTLLDGGAVLGKALAAIEASAGDADRIGDRVRHELMLAANRVHAADAQDLGDSDALKETARHVAATAGTGLAWLAEGDEARLGPTLTSTNVLHLFRVGHSLGLKLRADLRARVAHKGSGLGGRGLLRLDAPLREVVAGMLRVRPVLYAGLLDAARVDFRPIASLAELAAAAAAIGEAALRAALLERLGASEEALKDVDDADLPSHAMLLGAFLAHAAVGAPRVAPVDAATWAKATARVRTDANRDVAFAALDDVVRGSATPLPGTGDKDASVARARAYAAQVWKALGDEAAATGAAADLSFLSTVWTRPA